MAVDALAVTWAPSAVHGWGVFGANLLRDLLRRGAPKPILLAKPDPRYLDPPDRERLKGLIAEQAEIERQTAGIPGTVKLAGVHVIHSLGNGLEEPASARRFRGEPNVGFTFFETTDLPADIVERSSYLDIMMAGSSWNAEYLRDLGFPKVGCVFQGVDVDNFTPGPATGQFGDRFVIFSGGKLELRKGQDLVVAAFKRFHERHPDSLLVTVWLNPWPQVMADVAASPHTEGQPDPAVPFPDSINAWVRAQGVPEGAHRDLGLVPNGMMPKVLRECDAAVFANRCEGGTNLVAMETLATGVPSVLSANTGHLDLVADDRCYPLRNQGAVPFAPPGGGMWRESEVDEIVEALEAIYTDRAEAARRARAARDFMQRWSWRHQIDRLLTTLDELTD